MKTIWKFPLNIVDEQTVEMPKGAFILTAQAQQNTICLWAMVDPKQPIAERTIYIRGTGHPCQFELGYSAQGLVKYIDSVQVSYMVFHVFQKS